MGLFCSVTFETKIAFSVILKRRAKKVVCSQNEQCYHVKPYNKHVCEPKTKNRILLWEGCRWHPLGSQTTACNSWNSSIWDFLVSFDIESRKYWYIYFEFWTCKWLKYHAVFTSRTTENVKSVSDSKKYSVSLDASTKKTAMKINIQRKNLWFLNLNHNIKMIKQAILKVKKMKELIYISLKKKLQWSCSNKYIQVFKTNIKNFMIPFYRWGSPVSRLQSHYKETVYFLPLSPREFLILIWSTSEGWNAEFNLIPPSSSEPGTPGVRI